MKTTAANSSPDYFNMNPIELVILVIRDYPSIIATFLLAGVIAALAGAYVILLVVAHFPRAELPSERLYRTIMSDGRIAEGRELPDSFAYCESGGKGWEITKSKHEKENQKGAESGEIVVSVVVPAYNESLRLHLFLSDAIDFFTNEYPKRNNSALSSWEILIVDDGSRDDTSEVALEFTRKQIVLGKIIPEGSIRVCKLAKNRGKGGAVTHGMRHIRGKYAIFADADGATKFSDLRDLLGKCREVERDGYGVAVGSRAHMVNTDAVVKRSKIRNLLMYTFHTYLHIMGIKSIKDTQCGFKLFSLPALRAIFPHMHNEGWIFDVEILLLAERIGIPMVEVPVTWHEVEGSKVNLVKDSLKMAWDLIVLRGSYALGIYGVGVVRRL